MFEGHWSPLPQFCWTLSAHSILFTTPGKGPIFNLLALSPVLDYGCVYHRQRLTFTLSLSRSWGLRGWSLSALFLCGVWPNCWCAYVAIGSKPALTLTADAFITGGGIYNRAFQRAPAALLVPKDSDLNDAYLESVAVSHFISCYKNNLLKKHYFHGAKT